LTESADTGEYMPCGTGVLIKNNISFIHGLGGSSNSWAKQAVWTEQNYQSAVTNVNYDAKLQTSFHYICDELIQEQIEDGSEDVTGLYPNRCKLNDFAIAHSQGGIAARYLDWQWDDNQNGNFGTREFYGLVTFGTPHAGADIAITKTQHNAFIGQIASSIFLEKSYGKIYDFTSSFVGSFLGLSGADVISKIDDAIVNTLAPLSTGSLHTPTLDEMKPNSPTMDSINNHHSRLRKVAFYGIEEEPECWRVISGITDTASEDYPIWQASRDYHFQGKMEKARAAHEGEIVDLQNYLKGVFPLGNKRKEKESELKHRKDAVYFLNNANTQWRYLIGSYHKDSFKMVTEQRYKVTWDEKYGALGKWYSQERDGILNWWDAQSLYNNIEVYKKKNMQISSYSTTFKVQSFFPSDGVVLERSQRAYPGVGNRQDKLEGDNHFQERNSPEAERVMIKLYKGIYDSFFYTAP
jgi:pimeloyl-ACP methyl ester carboxylesterase